MASKSSLFALRVLFHIVGGCLSLIAFGLMVAAILTPYWTTFEANQVNQFHNHGLFQDCVYSAASSGGIGSSMCTYRNFLPAADERHDNLAFNQHHYNVRSTFLKILCLTSTAALVGFFSLFCTCCGCLWICCSITTVVFNLISTLFSLIAVVLMAVYINQPSSVMVQEATDTSLVHLSYSFYLALAASAMFFCATVFHLAASASAFAQQRVASEKNRKSQLDEITKTELDQKDLGFRDPGNPQNVTKEPLLLQPVRIYDPTKPVKQERSLLKSTGGYALKVSSC